LVESQRAVVIIRQPRPLPLFSILVRRCSHVQGTRPPQFQAPSADQTSPLRTLCSGSLLSRNDVCLSLSALRAPVVSRPPCLDNLPFLPVMDLLHPYDCSFSPSPRFRLPGARHPIREIRTTRAPPSSPFTSRHPMLPIVTYADPAPQRQLDGERSALPDESCSSIWW